MKKIKKTLKILAVTFLIACTFVTAVLFWTIAYPREAWNITSQYLLPSDLNIAWEKINFQSRKMSFLNYEINWKAENISIEKNDPSLKINVDIAAVKFTLDPFSKNEWLMIDTLKLHLKEKGYFKSTANNVIDSQSQQSLFQTIENYVQSLAYANQASRVNTLDIQVQKFELFLNEEDPPLNLSVSVLKDISTDNSILVKHEIIHGQLHLQMNAELKSQNLETPNPFLTTQVLLDFKEGSLKATLEGFYNDSKINLKLDPFLKIVSGKSSMNVDSKFEISLSDSLAALNGTADLKKISGPIISVSDILISAEMPMQNNRAWSPGPTVFNISAPVDIFLIDKDMRRPIEKACRCRMPESLKTQLNGQVWMSALMSHPSEQEKVLDARMSLESVRNKLFQADIAAGLIIQKINNQFLYEPSTDSHIKIFSFQGLREFLDSKGVLIPAPFDILEGTLDLTAKSPVSQKETRVETQVLLDVSLSSKNQKVDIALDANLNIAKAFNDLKINLKALIKSLKIELPPIDPILGFPSIVKDSRYLKKPRISSKKTKSSFTVHVESQIETQTPGAIKLLTSLAKPYIPISLSVLTSDKREPKAFVKVEPFSITYLRRNVFVEKFELKVKGTGENESPIDGKLRIEQGGYNVYINLAGTTDNPNINLTSDPYLPESDIVSVLLYGRVTKNLAAGDAQTAGSVNAAIADSAIGIFGLWAFAVTPIQSFSYNPITKIYVATVKLGSGLTAGVGTNWEQATNLELQKRISNRWVLTASWAEGVDKDSGEKLVLRWERRF